MKLSVEYLNERHTYWIYKIGALSIWNPLSFSPVEIVIRKNTKTYNGKFQRRTTLSFNKKKIEDKIFIYNKSEEFDPKFIDSVLVHEMIHQYIIQNDIKDTSTHGRIFRRYMQLINTAFPEELKIDIRSRNPALPEKGPGQTDHHILAMQHSENYWFIAIVNPRKVDYFENYLKVMGKRLNIKTHFWARSNDVYFNNFRRCTTSLHGVKKTCPEFIEFCKEYGVTKTYP